MNLELLPGEDTVKLCKVLLLSPESYYIRTTDVLQCEFRYKNTKALFKITI